MDEWILMILTHMIDIDETLKLTQGQGHILQQSTFGSMKMCICDKQARLTYLRGVNVLVLVCLLFFFILSTFSMIVTQTEAYYLLIIVNAERNKLE